jgi:hypothetical protein
LTGIFLETNQGVDAPMGDPRNHHFIPAFYLSRWSGEDGRLVEWSKPHNKIIPIRRHPNATGFQRDLYTFPELRPDSRQWFEKHFLKFTDDVASDALKRILTGEMTSLNDRQKSGWARFLMTLRFRHPDAVVELRESITNLWKTHDIFTLEVYSKIRSPSDPLTFGEYVSSFGPDANSRMELELLIAAMDNKGIGQQILEMAWGLIDLTAASRQLLTSDWPVELSLGTTPTSVVLPVSPTQLFVACQDENVILSMCQMPPGQLAANVNSYVVGSARRYVFSSDERQKRFIENRIFRTMQEQPFFPSLMLPAKDALKHSERKEDLLRLAHN